MATCYWERGVHEPGSNYEAFVVHKQCHEEFDRDRGAETWPTMELRHFIVDLMHNIGMSPEDAEKARESADSIRNLG